MFGIQSYSIYMLLDSPVTPGLQWRGEIWQHLQVATKWTPLKQSDHEWRGPGTPHPNAHPHTLRETENNMGLTKQLLAHITKPLTPVQEHLQGITSNRLTEASKCGFPHFFLREMDVGFPA